MNERRMGVDSSLVVAGARRTLRRLGTWRCLPSSFVLKVRSFSFKHRTGSIRISDVSIQSAGPSDWVGLSTCVSATHSVYLISNFRDKKASLDQLGKLLG